MRPWKTKKAFPGKLTVLLLLVSTLGFAGITQGSLYAAQVDCPDATDLAGDEPDVGDCPEDTDFIDIMDLPNFVDEIDMSSDIIDLRDIPIDNADFTDLPSVPDDGTDVIAIIDGIDITDIPSDVTDVIDNADFTDLPAIPNDDIDVLDSVDVADAPVVPSDVVDAVGSDNGDGTLLITSLPSTGQPGGQGFDRTVVVALIGGLSLMALAAAYGWRKRRPL